MADNTRPYLARIQCPLGHVLIAGTAQCIDEDDARVKIGNELAAVFDRLPPERRVCEECGAKEWRGVLQLAMARPTDGPLTTFQKAELIGLELTPETIAMLKAAEAEKGGPL